MALSSKLMLISALFVILLLVMIEILNKPVDALAAGIVGKGNNTIQHSTANYSDAINLSNNIGHSELPRLAVSGNSVYAVWADDTSGNRDIHFRKSTNYGCSFEETININNQSGGSVDPQIAVSGHYVYIIWEQSPENNGAVFFTRSTDNGDSFEKVQNIGNNTGFNGFPQVAVSGNNVYLIWHDATHGVFLTRSTDNGASFEKVQNIGNNTGFNGFPQVAVSGNNVYVVWAFDDHEKYGQVFFTRSTDNGVTFDVPLELTEAKDIVRHRLVFSPHIAVVPQTNSVFVVWHSGRIVHQETYNFNVLISDVLFKRSNDNGTTFDGIVNLSNKSGWSINPQIVASENNVYVVWTNNVQEKYGQVFFTRSTDNGATFDGIVNLSNKSGWSINPQIVASENNVYVVWTNNGTGNEETFFKSNKITDSCSTPNYRNSLENVDIDNNTSKNGRVLNIGFVDPTFTFAAYDKSFYLFYAMNDKTSDEYSNITDDADLFSSIVPAKYEHMVESNEIRDHLKWLSPRLNIDRLTDQDVDAGSIFTKGGNKYDIIVLGHQEYVTQREYDNLKQFVANGGTLILLDGNVFYAEVKYDKNTNAISLVKGHYWEYNGKSAWRSVEERWANETSEWAGSNFLCCWSLKIKFNNNPFGIEHEEEQHITNPRAKILLDYNATEDEPNPRKFVVATYELDYKKGKVITLGFYADHLKKNDRFWRFFDSLLYQYALGEQETKGR